MKRAVTAGTQIELAEMKLIFDGEVQAAEATVWLSHPKVQAPDGTVLTSEAKVATRRRGSRRRGQARRRRGSRLGRRSRCACEGGAGGDGSRLAARAPDCGDEGPDREEKVHGARADVVRRQISGAHVFARAVTAAAPFLTAVSGVSEGATTFRLEQRDHVYMFGRTRRCEFRVKTAEVSREHATFTRRSDGVYVNDLGSVNGVLVNNTRVSDFRLYDGDLIQVGRVRLRLFNPTETGHRGTDSVSSTPSRLAPQDGELRHEPPPAPERSASFRSERHAPRSDLHPAIAGHLASEGIYEGGHRPRRPSVRVRMTESWETSSRFRYGIVIVAAALLAFAAVTGRRSGSRS